jgi:predicted Zn-dependent protease
MLPDEPNDPMLRYMLANEFFKAGRYSDAIEHISTYLTLKEDEGAVFRLLAQSYQKLGKSSDAKQAYERGIEAANKHGHPGMAEEFQMAIDDLD